MLHFDDMTRWGLLIQKPSIFNRPTYQHNPTVILETGKKLFLY